MGKSAWDTIGSLALAPEHLFSHAVSNVPVIGPAISAIDNTVFPKSNNAPSVAGPAPFSPSEQSPMGLPQSLSQFSTLNSNQQASNIASQGVYGGGNGPDEKNYFLNLINRQLFDQSGNVAQNTNGIAPVDLSYLNQLGISGSTPTDYLKGISQYGT